MSPHAVGRSKKHPDSTERSSCLLFDETAVKDHVHDHKSHVILPTDEVYVYKIPPLKNAGGHRYVAVYKLECLFLASHCIIVLTIYLCRTYQRGGLEPGSTAANLSSAGGTSRRLFGARFHHQRSLGDTRAPTLLSIQSASRGWKSSNEYEYLVVERFSASHRAFAHSILSLVW